MAIWWVPVGHVIVAKYSSRLNVKPPIENV